jgi:hypothetical protein
MLPAAALILSLLLRLILVAWLNRGQSPHSWEYGMLAAFLLCLAPWTARN